MIRPTDTSRSRVPQPVRWGALILSWIALWTVIFSAVDFWTIKLFDVSHYPWFEAYRAVMRFGVSWVSPPSFALAENAYFLWVNSFDPSYAMDEWEFYSGNPINPDGHFNFVWGDDRGGWKKFPMLGWYGSWSIPTIPWIALAFLAASGRLKLWGRRRDLSGPFILARQSVSPPADWTRNLAATEKGVNGAR